MKAYLKWSKNNFGDELNDLIFPSLGYKKCIQYNKINLQSLDKDCILGLGTLLTKKVKSPVTVAGAGSDGQSKPQANLDYQFVRGKLTTKFLNLKDSLGIGDPVYYLFDYIHSKQLKVKKHKIGIIPHWKSLKQISSENVISPFLPVDDFINKVSECETILAEAMHGAMCADILRIPFAPIKIHGEFNEFKWQDWASIMGFDLRFGSLNNYNLISSSENMLNSTVQNVKEKLEGLRC